MQQESNKGINYTVSQCLQKPGQHIIIGGTTGTGKSQTLFHIINKMREAAPDEYLLIMDIGKSSEVLRLADFANLLFFIPAGKDIQIDYRSPEMELKYQGKISWTWFHSYDRVFEQLEPDKINILCIKPYHRRNDTYAREVSLFFQKLIDLASDRTLKTLNKLPLSIVIDEMHWVAPGHGSSLNDEHTDAGKDVQMNIDTLRSYKVRIIASTQNWRKIRKGVRDAFSWIFIKRGLSFPQDEEPRLSRFNLKWEGLSENELVIAFPKRGYSKIIELPYYGEGEDIGDIYYLTPKALSPSITDLAGSTLPHA